MRPSFSTPCDASPARDLRPSRGERAAIVGARVGFAAAACWIALGTESILRPEPANYRDALWMIPFALTTLTFAAVHVAQRERAAAPERVGFALLMVASVLVFLGNVGLLADQPLLATFSFPWGALLWCLGMIVFGVGTWRTAALPRAVAVAIILLEPVSILTGLALSPIAPLHDRGAYSAGVEKGAAVAVVALGLSAWARARTRRHGVPSGAPRVARAT
jgi:hypothetical protein